MRKFLALLLAFACPVHAGSSLTGYRTGGGSVVTSFGRGSIERNSTSGTSGGPVSPCSGIFADTTFTQSGTGTVNLDVDSPSGKIWIGVSASDGSLVIDRSADNVKSTVTSGVTKSAYLNEDLACADYSVSGSIKTGSTSNTNRGGLMGRYNGGTDSGYRFRIEGDGTARLEKVVNTTSSDLATSLISGFSATTSYSLELRMNGSSIQGYINGALACSASDTTYTAPGTAGLMARLTNARITSFSATYL